jgi:predicted nucleotidyltransferase
VSALYLFGSTARGEAGPASDIDLLCDIDPARRMGLFEFLGIQQNLEEILGNPVDLVEQKALLPTIANHVRRDMVRIF